MIADIRIKADDVRLYFDEDIILNDVWVAVSNLVSNVNSKKVSLIKGVVCDGPYIGRQCTIPSCKINAVTAHFSISD